MLRRTVLSLVSAFIMAMFIAIFSFAVLPAGRSFADSHPQLHLNRQMGPLGVTLTLNGSNFPPGVAGLTYIDSQDVPGTVSPPGHTSVQGFTNGNSVPPHLSLPQSIDSVP